MTDDRPVGAATGPSERIHDDDELAEAMAAELARYTGAIPILAPARPAADAEQQAATAAPRTPPVEPAAVPERPAPGSPAVPAGPVRPASVAPIGSSGSDPVPPAPSVPIPPPSAASLAADDAPAVAPARTEPAAPPPSAENAEHSRSLHPAKHVGPITGTVPVSGAPSGRRAARAAAVPLSAERPADAMPRSAARHDAPAPARPVEVAEPARPGTRARSEEPPLFTGETPVPSIYEAWERSIRSIGLPLLPDASPRRRAEDAPVRGDLGGDPHDGEEPEETQALDRAALGPLPEPYLPLRDDPDRRAAAEPSVGEPGAPEPSASEREEPEEVAASVDDARSPGPDDATDALALDADGVGASLLPPVAPFRRERAARRRESRRRFRADQPKDAGAGTTAQDVVEPGEPAELDEVETGIPAVLASDTAAIDLPPLVETPSTATGSIAVVPGEAPISVTGSPWVATGLWVGAVSSPLVVLLGGASSGGSPAAIPAILAGLLLGAPALLRLAASRLTGTAAVQQVLGHRPGVAGAVVLLLARLAAATVALLAVGDLAAAYTTRTGVGGSAGTASVGAVLLTGLFALAATAWPRRVSVGVLLALGAVGLFGTVVLLGVLGRSGGGAAAAGGSAFGTWAAAFAVLGLVLPAAWPDLLRSGAAGSRREALVAAAVAAAAGAVLLGAAAVVTGSAGGADAATGLVGVFADATPASAAGPLAALLLAAAVPMPALLLRSVGDGAAVLLGGGRSGRLGTVAAGLLALAVALAVVASGGDAGTALPVVGAVLGVPLAVWAGVLALTPLEPLADAVRAVLVRGAVAATLVGWLLTDALLVPGERSPLLGALAAPWRGTPALGLLAAFVLGVVVGGGGWLAARRGMPPSPERMRSGEEQPVDSLGA